MSWQKEWNRMVLSSNDYFKIVTDYPEKPILDLSWICAKKILLILEEWHNLSWKVVFSKSSEIFTIASSSWNSYWSLDLNFVKSKHIKVRIIWTNWDVRISNATSLSTRMNKWFIRIRPKGAEYEIIKKDL